MRSISRQYNRLKLTDHYMNRFFAEVQKWSDHPALTRKYIRQMKAILPFPDKLPAFKSILADGNGNIWVQTYESKTIEGTEMHAYDIFDQSGKYLTRSWLAAQIGKCLIRGGKFYNMVFDEETLLHKLVRYNIIIKNNAVKTAYYSNRKFVKN